MVALCKETTGHQEIASLLFNAMDNEKECLSYVQLSTAMFDAAKSGNIMILEFLLKDHPDLLFEVDCKEQRSLLHIAMLYRQESVYRLILNKGDSKKVMIQLIDFEGNNILHLAGMPARPEERFGLSTDHVLMHSEERWFQSHKELHKEAVSEVKDAANTLVVVATLVISLGITAGMTISVNDIDAILPSSWEPKDDSVHLRQTKLVFGNITLFGVSCNHVYCYCFRFHIDL
ncbi:uncharacterized protein LOC114373299 [Glycine soja]|uniref:uncharacterized protein n=1 Tax=Glycine max TaxID=3847 RepID=UPI0003DEC90F|nr:uncharacterized protein LOC102666727 [Glycine max]XP_028186594.1 uncharacterized protein LOC114373299 [Glycine soja]|eukprot:XP_006595404.1 uncharacterized protein LOC102666727 [Glycine max]